ncbi:GntR family transcriptional regulator [Microbispora sp. RL4-1S]|uniref:GntR family transcriptional regulator n=1 Tax=Microbispora oryzae TaxID=2806554 RepID=A0A940WJ85_9ACTN|nr:GntR family transcriptional regulator [Microbispora oryzae]MBP2703833.1 GntR family transcriptional regulator [Microbispora oryzae]
MLIVVDPSSALPLADQVADCVRAAVARGDAVPGDRLPPARTVAAALGINLHTVLRGYQRLRDEGLVELRRGRSATITDAAADWPRRGLVEAAEEFAAAVRRLGVSDEEAVDTVRSALSSR